MLRIVLRVAIEDFLVQKKKGNEFDPGPGISVISDFIESEIARVKTNMLGVDLPLSGLYVAGPLERDGGLLPL
jgi:hypothetical protein